MALPGNGIFVVRGEMTTLMTAMRRGIRWSSHSHQDEEMDILVRSFQDLKLILNKIEDLRLIDPSVFINPFLEVIRSEDTTGPATSLALMAINKFLSYGLLDPTHHSVPVVVDNIADAVTHAKFVGTDQSSDGVVLMKILQVLRTLTLSPEGAALTNDSLCEIMLACFRICFETRLSELLRRTAELYLKDMVQLVFMRLPQFPEDLRPSSMKQLKMKPGVMEQSRSRRKSRSAHKNRKSNSNTISQEVTEQKIENEETASLKVSSWSDSTSLSQTSKGNIVDMQGSISQPAKVSSSDVSPLEEKQQECNQQENATTDNSSEKDTITNKKDEAQVPEDVDASEEKKEEGEKELDSSSLSSVAPEGSLSRTTSAENMSEPQKETGETSKARQEEYVNPRGIRFTPQNQESTVLLPYGLVCVREMFRFLISLCNPLDKQNTDTMIHLGLSLLTVAFEVGADSIGKYASLLSLVKNNLCRNLISLLTTERISIFTVNLQVSFLMFESLRSHLKFQLELYLTKLIEIITSDSVKVTYEHREIALDNIVQLWRIPGFVTELYLNYDCSMYCSNLFEDLTKLLAKNAFPAATGVYPTHLLSLDALLTVIENIEKHCMEITKVKFENVSITVSEGENTDGSESVESINNFLGKPVRQKVSDHLPSREDLLKVKDVKKWLPQGNEYFNLEPKKGIQFLQEHGVLKPEFDPQEIVVFLRENPALDKKRIGEFLSHRKNRQILETFVKMFNFTNTRIDEALRMFLEPFRLPGESLQITALLEQFADHWHKSNGEPFANADAAYILAYAIIMLNVDQHNHNVRKQNNPMTCEGFKKNLKGVNGGSNFDQNMLDEIYNAIKNEEIVMPAEHTGLVKENYLWKVLLHRGSTKDGIYIHTSSEAFDIDLFNLIWGPIVSALSFVFDKSEDQTVYKRALKGFESCAAISSYFGITKNLDMLVLTLCKFTLFHNQQNRNVSAMNFGSNVKAQTAFKAVFGLVHQYGDNIREGWKNVLDLILSLYNANLLPKSFLEVEDFTEPDGKITLVCEPVQFQKQDSGLFSSLYLYMVSSSESLNKIPTPEEQQLIDVANKCIQECNLDQLVSDSKFLHEDALLELVKALIELSRGPDVEKSSGYNYNENIAVFFLELLLRVVIQNRDRVMSIWQIVRDHLYTLVMNASYFDYQFLLERSVIGLLRLAIRLMRNEEMSPIVVQSLRMLLLLKSTTIFKISVQISCGLYELLKTSAQNIHTSTDWSIIFTLLECVGAGAQPPKPVSEDNHAEQETRSEGDGVASSEDEVVSSDRGYTSDSELTHSPKVTSRSQSPAAVRNLPSPINTPTNTGGWILVGSEGEVQPVIGRTPPADQYSLALECSLGPHKPKALLKCCESLAFLVRDVAHITPYNFDNCVHCVRTFVETSLNGGKRKQRILDRESRSRRKGSSRRSELASRRSPATSSPDEDESDDEYVSNGYHQISIQLLDLMHTLHTRTAQIFRWWAEEGGEIAQETSLWSQGWCPLLQGIARLCCDTRRQVRMSAITYLQRALLVHDLQTLSGTEWEACFHRVLFPLLTLLLQPIGPKDPQIMEETRMRAATLLSKVFLHHLTPLLSLPTFTNLWLTILDYMDKYMHADKSDLLYEAIPESLKNMLLVMESAKVFDAQDGSEQLWTATWDRISGFLPHLKEELFAERELLSVDKKQNVGESVPSSPSPPPLPSPPPSVNVAQHNIENATRSSIILQPPSSGNNVVSPLFSHLGQMVSTPIGAPTSDFQYIVPRAVTKTDQIFQQNQQITVTSSAFVQQYPASNYQTNTNNLLIYIPSSEGHTFPVLYSTPPVVTETRPTSLYGEYLSNPYNLVAANENDQKKDDANVPQATKVDEEGEKEPPTADNEINKQVPSIEKDVSKTKSNSDMSMVGSNVLSNYFQSSSNSNFILPGMEILFGSSESNVNSKDDISVNSGRNIPSDSINVTSD